MTRCRICKACPADVSGVCSTCGMKAVNRARMERGETKVCPYCRGTKSVTWGRHEACDYCPDDEKEKTA